MKRKILVRPTGWACLLLLFGFLAGCGSTPQLGDNEDAVRAADALWTAVTSRRQPLIEDCAQEIDRLHQSGDMTEDAHAHLVGIIADARESNWEDSVAGLKSFLQGQRRVK